MGPRRRRGGGNADIGERRIDLLNQLRQVADGYRIVRDVAGHDITTAASLIGATIDQGITLDADERLPAIGRIVSLRSTAGSLAVQGTHVVSDSGGTALVPSATFPGVATLSDDGKTVTFQAGVTAFVLVYYPRPDVELTTSFPIGAP